MLGSCLALSPKGDRLAVAGYPGLAVLDAASGKVLGATKAEPIVGALPIWTANEMVAVAWNSAGSLVAGAWRNTFKGDAKDPRKPLELALLDAEGKAQASPGGFAATFGLAFVPGGDVLLVGTDKLTAVNVKDGKTLWTNDIKGAQAFAFSADGKTAAAGGHGCNAACFPLDTGKLAAAPAKLPGMVGGVAFLPSGDLAVAVWGRTNPLMILPAAGAAGADKPATLFQSSFGFQNVLYSPDLKALVAAEQGGRIWLIGENGKSMLSEDAGTTPYRMTLAGPNVLVARMNRVVQVISK
jgi:WD40 repeat protein